MNANHSRHLRRIDRCIFTFPFVPLQSFDEVSLIDDGLVFAVLIWPVREGYHGNTRIVVLVPTNRLDRCLRRAARWTPNSSSSSQPADHEERHPWTTNPRRPLRSAEYRPQMKTSHRRLGHVAAGTRRYDRPTADTSPRCLSSRSILSLGLNSSAPELRLPAPEPHE